MKETSDKPAKSHKVRNGAFGCLGILVVLGVIGALAAPEDKGGAEKGQAATAAAPAATPPLAVTARELFAAYEANEAAAQETYGGRSLAVTGVIDKIDLDMSDEPVVMLRTSNQFMSARAELLDASQPKAKSLTKGQKITMVCGGVGEVMGIPMLSDCELP